jgi:hypothetical protein
MPNNPKNHSGHGTCGLREYFQPGQGCLRELAAYLLDEGHFCRVPATALVHCEHPAFHYPSTGGDQPKLFPKFGSMQEYVSAAEPFDDIGPNLLRFDCFAIPSPSHFSFRSDFEVQKIALFDIRLLNCDRNAANILVRKSPSSSGASRSYQLVPIDHGYCIPPKLKIFEWDWAWYHHPHVSRPVCPEIISYLRSIDIDQLLDKVSGHVMLTDDCQFLLRLSHFLLLNGLALGLSLKDIATLICRTGDNEETPSQLEKLISEAEDNAYRVIELTFHQEHSHTHLSATPRAESISPNVEYSPLRRRSTSSLSHNNLQLLGDSAFPQKQEEQQVAGKIGKQGRSSSEDNTLYLSHAAAASGKLRSPKRKNSRHSSFPAHLPHPHPPLSPSRVRGVSLLSTDSESQSSIFDPFEFAQRVSLDSIASASASSITSAAHGPTPPPKLIVCPNPKLGSEFSSLQKLFPPDSSSTPPHSDPSHASETLPSISSSSPLSPTTILSSFQRVPVTKSPSSSDDVIVDLQIASELRMDSSNTDHSTDAASVSHVDDEIFLDDSFLFRCPPPPSKDTRLLDLSSPSLGPQGGELIQEEYGFFTTHLPPPSSSLRDDTPSSLFDVNLPEPIPLSRVASFCGFESSPLCHHETTPVMSGTTRMEKRRLISETEQFKKLREEYSELFTLKLLRRLSSTSAAAAAASPSVPVPMK